MIVFVAAAVVSVWVVSVWVVSVFFGGGYHGVLDQNLALTPVGSLLQSKHCVIKTVHPSPLSAHRGFFGTQQFTRANAYLEEHGKPPVDWSSVCADVDPNAPRP